MTPTEARTASLAARRKGLGIDEKVAKLMKEIEEATALGKFEVDFEVWDGDSASDDVLREIVGSEWKCQRMSYDARNRSTTYRIFW